MTNVLDMTVVDELIALCDDGDPELLIDLIGMFLDDAPSKIASVLEGLRTCDLARVERAAHSLKGSSGNLGARQLQDACEQLQLLSHRGDLDGVRKAASQLLPVFGEVQHALLQLRRQFT